MDDDSDVEFSFDEDKENSLQAIANEVYYLLSAGVSSAEIIDQVLVIINEKSEMQT